MKERWLLCYHGRREAGEGLQLLNLIRDLFFSRGGVTGDLGVTGIAGLQPVRSLRMVASSTNFKSKSAGSSPYLSLNCHRLSSYFFLCFLPNAEGSLILERCIFSISSKQTSSPVAFNTAQPCNFPIKISSPSIRLFFDLFAFNSSIHFFPAFIARSSSCESFLPRVEEDFVESVSGVAAKT